MAEVMHEKEATQTKYSSDNSTPPVTAEDNVLVNASGHVQEVDRKYVHQILRAQPNTNATPLTASVC